MNIRKLCKIETGLQHLEDAQDVPMIEIVEALIGVCFDEEEAGEVKAHMSDEEDV